MIDDIRRRRSDKILGKTQRSVDDESLKKQIVA